VALTDPVQLTRKIREALAPCSLGGWPTPLDPAPGLGGALGLTALWLKREDRSSPAGGGVKVRGLEFLLAGAPADAVFVTVGGTASTHCLATAVHARALGRRAVLAQFPQPETAAARAVVAATGAVADLVVRAGGRLTFPVALWRAWRAAGRLAGPGGRRWIPGGGAHPRGVAGHCCAGLELAAQCAAGAPPDAVVAPLGSGGTAAGLLLAIAALGWPTAIIGVRVAPRVVANSWRVRRLARGAESLLQAHGISLPRPAGPLRIVDGLGRGYGYPTPAGEAARALAAEHGVTLDPTYGAKALAALAPLAARGFRRIVFWHTFAAP
jgi:D-cysteine desulfhydrase